VRLSLHNLLHCDARVIEYCSIKA
jgi:hypothetical protein